jgi:hypothetical protein
MLNHILWVSQQCGLWLCLAETTKLHAEADHLSLAPKMFKHVTVVLCIDCDGLSNVIFKQGPIILKDETTPQSDPQTVQRLLMKFLGIFYGPTVEILSIYGTSYVEVHFIAHQHTGHEVWLVVHQLQQNCVTLYM